MVTDLALSLLWLSFSSWPRNLCRLWMWPKNKWIRQKKIKILSQYFQLDIFKKNIFRVLVNLPIFYIIDFSFCLCHCLLFAYCGLNFLLLFLVRDFLKSSFRFRTKLGRKYRDFLSTPCPHT